MIPIAGSAYTYAYATLGELVAWIIGWDLILEYLFGAATVAVGWAGYFRDFLSELGINLPAAFMAAPLSWDNAAGRVPPRAGRRAQSAGGAAGGRDDDAARDRDQGIRPVQQRHRVCQSRDRDAGDRVRIHARQSGELAPVHSAQSDRRVRELWRRRRVCAPQRWCSSRTLGSMPSRRRRRRRRIHNATCRSGCWVRSPSVRCCTC